MPNFDSRNEQTESPTALLVSYDRVHFSELLETARVLKQSGKYRPVVCFVWDYPERACDVDVCERAEIACCNGAAQHLTSPESTSALPPTQPKGPAFQFAASISRPIRHWLAACRRKSIFAEYVRYHRLIRKARLLLKRTNPVVAVLAGDHVEDISGPMIRAANERNIPVVVIPYTLCTSDEAAQYYYENPLYQVRGLRNKFAARRFPQWTYSFNGRKLLRLPAAGVLANEWLNLAPEEPWVPNSGKFDKLLTESQALTKYWKNAGIIPEKLVETGSPIIDSLYAVTKNAVSLRAELNQRLKFTPGENRLLLCAFPFSAFPSRAEHCEFDTYDSLIKYWVQSFAGLNNWHVVIRLHPRLRIADFIKYETPNMRFCEDSTYSLVPLCDLFVASASATIRWAIACGRPTLNYDVYQFGYKDYESATGVLTVSKKVEFERTLKRLACDGDFLRQTTQSQVSCAPQWGKLDGKAGDRIIAALTEIVARRGVNQ